VPLSSRELLIIMRARDEASRVIREVGRGLGSLRTEGSLTAGQVGAASAALTATGASMLAVGTTGIRVLNGMADAAAEFDQQAALTLTQVDQVGVKLEDIKTISKNVAAAIPAPFEQLQPALFDIFSSMDVNTEQAQQILTGFAKEAVAGQVDVQEAGRSTIAIMNAWGLSTDELNNVLDFQFQLVRKGVGTFAEFADAIGLGIPSAVKAGQTYQQYGGMLAFLTRNGLQVPSAVAAAQRAMDSFANPKVVQRLQNMGIAVTDLTGNFRPMNEVVSELGQKWAGLTNPQRNAALEELLKGAGGTQQAKRFWSLALTNFDELNQRVDEMNNSSGQLQAAYDIMFEQPQSQIQQMKNDLMLLRTEIGDQLIPAKLKLLRTIERLIHAWQALSPHTKKTIVQMVLMASVFMTVVGAVLLITGLILGLVAAFMFMGATFSGAIIIILAIIAALAALAVAAYEVYKHWDQVKPLITDMWKEVRDKVTKYWDEISDWVKKVWPEVRDWVVNTSREAWEKAKEYWGDLKDFVIGAWNWLRDNVPPVVQAMWDGIVAVFSTIWDYIKPFLDTMVQAMADMWSVIRDDAVRIWGALKDNIGPIVEDIWQIIQSLIDRLTPVWNAFWTWAKDYAVLLWNVIKVAAQVFWTDLQGIFTVASTILSTAWGIFWTLLKDVFKGVIDLVAAIFEGGLEIIRGLFDVFTGIFTGDWQKAWDGIREIFDGFWTLIKGVFEAGWQLGIVAPFDLAKGVLFGAWDIFWTGLRTSIDTLMDNIKTIFEGLSGLVTGAWQLSMDTLALIWSGFWAGLQGPVDAMVSGLGAVWTALDSIYIWMRDRVETLVGWFERIGRAIPNVPGWVSNLGGGVAGLFRASGGVVSAMTPYVVGERGPELFIPGRSGTIVPNRNLGGGGNNVNVSISEGAVVIQGNANQQDVEAALEAFKYDLMAELRQL
jgi:TP901 family phage tail tape measure protein